MNLLEQASDMSCNFRETPIIIYLTASMFKDNLVSQLINTKVDDLCKISSSTGLCELQLLANPIKHNLSTMSMRNKTNNGCSLIVWLQFNCPISFDLVQLERMTVL